jgi:hypothetical protein
VCVREERENGDSRRERKLEIETDRDRETGKKE